MKKYDLIFSVGRVCACSQALRRAGLQLLSLPWDWVTINPIPPGPDILIRMHIMESGFSDWMQKEDMAFLKTNVGSGKDAYKNVRYKTAYVHDFPCGVPLDESYPAVKEKYDRRVARFTRLIAEAKTRVLAVYMDTPVVPNTDVATCMEAHKRLQALYPHVKVDFLMISLELGRRFEDRIVEELADGFTHVSFDFKDYRPNQPKHAVDIAQCAEAMKDLASVRDYRTPAEIKAMKERTRMRKMQECGAKNAWDYFLIRRRRDLARLKNLFLPRATGRGCL